MRSFLLWFVSPVLLYAQVSSYPEVYPAARQGSQYMHNYYLPPAPSSTPWWPSWSPDGKSIAFAMHGSIWKVDLATNIATQLTYGPKYHSSPPRPVPAAFFHFTADNDARSIQLEILNVATGETTALTSDEQVYLEPAWSPDGKMLAYVSTKPSGYFNIYMRPIGEGRWTGDG